MACELQGLRVDDVDVRGGYGENDTVRFCNVLGYQITSLLLDIRGLVADGYLGEGF